MNVRKTYAQLCKEAGIVPAELRGQFNLMASTTSRATGKKTYTSKSAAMYDALVILGASRVSYALATDFVRSMTSGH